VNVPFLDLKAQYESIRSEVDEAVLSVLASQHFVNGPRAAQLEEAVAALHGVPYGVAVSSGTDAILIALMALNIRSGDEVITTPYTFFSTAGCIVRLGAKPVFIDVCEDTLNMDPTQIAKAITPRTRAILPVHLFGQAADMEPILDIACQRNIPVIEDAAQAIGARHRSQSVCGFGVAGTLSFFPSKNLGGLGDGGMVLTRSEELYHKMKLLRNHGMAPKYHYKVLGGNFRMDEIQAAPLLAKLNHLASWTAKRQQNAAHYESRFAGSRVEIPIIRPENGCIFNQFVIRVEDRDELQHFLKERGVGSEIYYPVPLHLQECFAALGYRNGSFPVAESAAACSLALPIYPELTRTMIDTVADAVLEFVSQ